MNGRVTEITVSLDLTVQPKSYQSVKLGVTISKQFEKEDNVDSELETQVLRRQVSKMLLDGLQEEVAKVYGPVVADYVVNQAGSQEPRRPGNGAAS